MIPNTYKLCDNLIDNLLLVRHGQSQANAKGIFPGRMHFPLTKEGISQAQFISNFLSRVKISAAYSSPMLRAFQTARIIAAPHGIGIGIRDEMMERDVGTLQGKPFLDKYKGWQEVKEYKESFQEMEKRVAKELLGMVNKLEGNVLVVSHADPIRAAIYHFLGIPARKSAKYVMSMDCGSLSVISFRYNTPNMVLFNYSKETISRLE